MVALEIETVGPEDEDDIIDASNRKWNPVLGFFRDKFGSASSSPSFIVLGLLCLACIAAAIGHYYFLFLAGPLFLISDGSILFLISDWSILSCF